MVALYITQQHTAIHRSTMQHTATHCNTGDIGCEGIADESCSCILLIHLLRIHVSRYLLRINLCHHISCEYICASISARVAMCWVCADLCVGVCAVQRVGVCAVLCVGVCGVLCVGLCGVGGGKRVSPMFMGRNTRLYIHISLFCRISSLL